MIKYQILKKQSPTEYICEMKLIQFQTNTSCTYKSHLETLFMMMELVIKPSNCLVHQSNIGKQSSAHIHNFFCFFDQKYFRTYNHFTMLGMAWVREQRQKPMFTYFYPLHVYCIHVNLEHSPKNDVKNMMQKKQQLYI